MNGPTVPEPCDTFSQELSAFLDGELRFPECLPAVDHLATCEACRAFYLATRRLSERVAAEPAPPASDELWARVAARVNGATPSGFPPAPSGAVSSRDEGTGRFPRRRALGLGLAAAAVIAVTLATSGRRAIERPDPAAGVPVASALREIVVEGARGRMTDERFVSIMAEILSADRKYHRETERVLELVDRRETAAASEETDAPRSEEPEADEDESGEGETARDPRLPS